MAPTVDSFIEKLWSKFKKNQGTPEGTPRTSASSSSRPSTSESEIGTPSASPPSSNRSSSSHNGEGICSNRPSGGNGPVFYIRDCTGVIIGDKHTYYTGTVYEANEHRTANDMNQLQDFLQEEQPEMVGKDNDIALLMESTAEVSRKYLLHTSEYGGKSWRKALRSLGVDDRIIDNFLDENPREPIREIRFQILQDWQRNSDNATLGFLSTKLWETGHRQLVHELSIMYKEERLRREPEVEL